MFSDMEKSDQKVFVTRDMKTTDVLREYKEARELFTESGMFCAGCECAEAETLEEALAIHCMDIDATIDYLNAKIRDDREK